MANKFSSTSKLYTHFLACAIESLNIEVIEQVISAFGSEIDKKDHDIEMAMYEVVRSENTDIVELLYTLGFEIPDSPMRVVLDNSSPKMVAALYKHNPDYFESGFTKYREEVNAATYAFIDGRTDITEILVNAGQSFTREDFPIARLCRDFITNAWSSQVKYILTHWDINSEDIDNLEPSERNTFIKSIITTNETTLLPVALNNPTLKPLLCSPKSIATAYENKKFESLSCIYKAADEFVIDPAYLGEKADAEAMLTMAAPDSNLFDPLLHLLIDNLKGVKTFAIVRILTALIESENTSSLKKFIANIEDFYAKLGGPDGGYSVTHYYRLCYNHVGCRELMRELLTPLSDSIRQNHQYIIDSFKLGCSTGISDRDVPVYLPLFLDVLEEYNDLEPQFFIEFTQMLKHIHLPSIYEKNSNLITNAVVGLYQKAKAICGDSAFYDLKEHFYENKSPAQILSMARRSLVSDNNNHMKGHVFLFMLACMPDSEKNDYLNKMAEKSNLKRDTLYHRAIELWSMGPTDILNRPLSNKAKQAILSSMT